MRNVNDNAIDPLGGLGAPIREQKPAAPDPIKSFEQASDRPLIGNTDKAIKSIADTFRKKATKDEQTCDWGAQLVDMNAQWLKPTAEALPRIQWRWTITEIVPTPSGPREIYADRWFFEGGNEEGYKSEEAAEDARALHFSQFFVIPGGDFAGLAEFNAWIETELQKLCGIPVQTGDTLIFRRPMPYANDVRLLDGESEA